MKNRITFYPTPFPDEHILGTLARWHSMLDRRTFLKSIAELTSNAFAINPGCIWRLVYRDLFGIYESQFAAEKFLRHTLWHYYLPFHHEKQDILFVSENVELKKLNPTEQIRIKTARNWRWCHLCAREDMDKYGTTYWHASQQVPSIIHCHKHGGRLIYSCSHCGFNSMDLATLLLPPTENKCPACKAKFDTTEVNNPIVKWMEAITGKLIFSPKANAISEIKKILIEKANLPQSHQRVPSKDSRQMASIQSEFDKFLYGSQIVEHYFQFPSKNLGPRAPYLQVPLMLYSETFFPPLYYLLLMKSLIKDDSELEHILVEKENFYA
ncbi:MAG: hypothetical protein EOO53_12240 [Gammaproteobacteria bacterium]|nr:MAG: hypothetical protein EOO53_12240 [Gammaproteobacteria bacterium]